MASAILEFNYDISCPFAYIASTRVEALADRTGATLIWRPVLLGAIYRATEAPQGAKGSASDVFNPTRRAIGATSMGRTIRRYQIAYDPPSAHPITTVNALRLLHAVQGDDRILLTKLLFKAYWADGVNVNNDEELLKIVRESKIASAHKISPETWADSEPRQQLESATSDAVARGAFGVPAFWIPEAQWVDASGKTVKGRFFWGQDRMHFVEATLLGMRNGGVSNWQQVSDLKSLMPRCIPKNEVAGKVKLEFWYDFSSPWAFLGWTQAQRLQRSFGPELEIVMRPFLLGILFREIGAPNLPSSVISPAKGAWSRQDHRDWTNYWNAVNAQEGRHDKNIDFYWADVFPIRTPTVLRVAMAEPSAVPVLYRGCWEKNVDMANDKVLIEILNQAGYNGADLIQKANTPEIKRQLRDATAEAKALGLCGVPSYRVLRQDKSGQWNLQGGIVWGQDEMNVVEDLIAGWDAEQSTIIAEPRKGKLTSSTSGAKL